MPGTNVHRRALTLIDLLVVQFVIALVVVLLLPMRSLPRAHARQIKCATQVRNITQALVIFENNGDDRYPLPSRLDVNNATVADKGRAKDTTANIFSILCYNSSISPEMLFCPSETNSKIKVHSGYQNVDPVKAVDPSHALWDPSLSADFTAGDSHISYATAITDGEPDAAGRGASGRLRHWANTFDPRRACLGNRGPATTGRDANGNIQYDRMSNTLAIHGSRVTWEGNIAYNDVHVDFETRMDPSHVVYTVAGGKLKPDILFVDETDDTDGLNTFLGIWTKAGSTPAEFKGIHD